MGLIETRINKTRRMQYKYNIKCHSSLKFVYAYELVLSLNIFTDVHIPFNVALNDVLNKFIDRFNFRQPSSSQHSLNEILI